PSYLLVDNSPHATVTARVESTTGTLIRVANMTLQDGVGYPGQINSTVMLDDGRRDIDGDVTAGDHVYTNNGLGPRYNGLPPGPRTARIQAVNRPGDGRYPGIAVEVGGLTVVTQAPTAPTSSVNVLPAFTASADVPVSWSGTAGGGGAIASYDVFV